MQLNALRYFVMVATTGSFAATAKHFQVPPSSVSRFISGLEQEIGQQLFYRNTRSVRLTEIGENTMSKLGMYLILLISLTSKLQVRVLV